MFTIYLSSFSGESTERSLWVKHVWGEKECTKENLFEILWNRTGIRLCLTFSHWFGTKLVRLVWNQLENGKYNLTSGWFNNISKRFLCVWWIGCEVSEIGGCAWAELKNRIAVAAITNIVVVFIRSITYMFIVCIYKYIYILCIHMHTYLII